MDKEYSLRQIKHARTKIAIMNAFIEALRSTRFDDISIRQICKNVEISEGTFFNYFPTKIDILHYYMHLLFLEVAWRSRQDVPDMRFPDFINTLFVHIAEKSANVNIISQILSIMLLQPERTKVVDIADIEKAIALPDCPGIEKIPAVLMDHFFRSCLKEAARKGELSKNAKIDDIVVSLMSILGGTMLASRFMELKDRKYHYKRQLQILWKGLGIQSK